MAGIGFELNKMARRDDLMGIAGAYLHSLFAIAGPWLFTVVALAFTTYLYGGSNNIELLNFRGVIVYNFSFSLALSALTFFLAAALLLSHVRKLPYHAFITNNNSVKLPKAGTSAAYYETEGEFNMGVDRREIIHPSKA
jgi:hypothetical protein